MTLLVKNRDALAKSALLDLQSRVHPFNRLAIRQLPCSVSFLFPTTESIEGNIPRRKVRVYSTEGPCSNTIYHFRMH